MALANARRLTRSKSPRQRADRTMLGRYPVTARLAETGIGPDGGAAVPACPR